MEETDEDLQHEVKRYRPPEESLFLDKGETQRLNTFLKNQYCRVVIEVTDNLTPILTMSSIKL